MLTNFSNSTYNALQITGRHRVKEGLDVTANYSFSKVLSDAAGDSQSRIEQFLDVNNPKLERAPANFDLRHSIKSAVVYDLPFGAKHYLHARSLDRFIGGWSLGTNLSWQSGAPFSILSGYGTLNRADQSRSYYNTADITIPGQNLPEFVHYQMTGNGPFIVSSSAINPADGTGTGFTGNIFTNPGAGTLGVLPRQNVVRGQDVQWMRCQSAQEHSAQGRAIAAVADRRRERPEPPDVLVGRSEHQLNHLRGHGINAEQPAHYAGRGALPLLSLKFDLVESGALSPLSSALPAGYPFDFSRNARMVAFTSGLSAPGL